jgi:hypothetical protein
MTPTISPASEPNSSATAITIAAAMANMIRTRNMSASRFSGLWGCGVDGGDTRRS